MRRSYFFSLLLSFLLMGCRVVGPRYESPQVDIPDQWHTPSSEGMSLTCCDDFLWWESLNDSTLNALLQKGAEQNLDLLIAGTRILEARLMGKQKEAGTYPHIDATLTAGDLYCSKDILKHGILGKCDAHKRNMGFFEAGFDAEWEIDLFGFHKHQVNAAQARIEATEASLCDVWISLSAEIARNYIELRGFQKREKILKEKIANWHEQLHLTQELLTIGMAKDGDVIHVKEQLNLLMAEVPLTHLSIDKAIHRISILLGYPPGELFAELCQTRELPHLPDEKPLGIPSELLRRRPDIRKAERELAAATEEVGTAVAALFPRFSLYGFVGEIGTHLRSMTNGNGLTWFAAPQLLFPIFNSRALKQDVKFSQIQARQALFEYQKTVLAALQEVEDALATHRHERERELQLNEVISLSQSANQIDQDLYQRGIQDYLEVLRSHRSLLEAEEAHLQSEINLLLNYIALYKALGGGWNISQCQLGTLGCS